MNLVKTSDHCELHELNSNELVNIEGGVVPPVVAAIVVVGTAVAAGYAIYEAGKAVGEFAYWISH